MPIRFAYIPYSIFSLRKSQRDVFLSPQRTRLNILCQSFPLWNWIMKSLSPASKVSFLCSPPSREPFLPGKVWDLLFSLLRQSTVQIKYGSSVGSMDRQNCWSRLIRILVGRCCWALVFYSNERSSLRCIFVSNNFKLNKLHPTGVLYIVFNSYTVFSMKISPYVWNTKY